MSHLKSMYALGYDHVGIDCVSSLTLLTDLYQLTMAQGYWGRGRVEDEAVFHLFFRKNPFGGGYAVAAGLETAVEYLNNFAFTEADIEWLAGLKGSNERALFDPSFLEYLGEMQLELTIDAVPEGTVVFPHEPLVRVQGPLIQCQIVETFLLNIINFQTLVATKASRICQAAGDDPVLEFGLRRAQGIDGALMASRAAYIGGCAATSNVLASRIFGIPVKGTHAHSWVQSFGSELEAFEAWAQTSPNNAVFLVDTYDTLEGTRRAVEVAKELRDRGYKMVGIRLDSGDLAWLSKEARKILDEAGFEDAKIVASNSLDEHVVRSLKQQNAEIRVWGVGTRLATAYDQPALGGVYKLSAVRKEKGEWEPRIKLSEQKIKVSNPGKLQVARYRDHETGEFVMDMIIDDMFGDPTRTQYIVDPMDHTRRKSVDDHWEVDELLEPVFQKGVWVSNRPPLDTIRQRTKDQLAGFHGGIKRFKHPHQYPVGLSPDLDERRTQLILEARSQEEW